MKKSAGKAGSGTEGGAQLMLRESALFSLGEVKERLGLEPELFLHLAARRVIRVCVEVPTGARVFSVDPDSTDLGDSLFAQLEVLNQKAPEKDNRPEPMRWAVRALVVTPEDCEYLRDYISKEAQFFREAIEISDSYGLGGPPIPLLVHPVRLPLFADTSGTLVDQTRNLFGVYPRGTEIRFIEGVGYQTPLDIHLESGELRITGADLEIVLAEVGDYVSLDLTKEQVQQPDAGVAKSKRKKIAHESSLGFLRLEDVLSELGISESTLYNFYDKKHPSYDPTFPRQVQITGRLVGWHKVEIEQWVKSRPRTERS